MNTAIYFVVVFCLIAVQVAATSPCLEWVLGYSSESCSETCSKASKTCSLSDLQAVTSLSAFEAAVASSRQLGKTEVPGSVSAFCTGGVNAWTFATAPAAMQYPLYLKDSDSDTGHYEMTNSCYFPEGGLQGDCDTVFNVPPAQRFCPCDSATC